MKIIPSINTETFEEAKKRIDILKNIVKEFHIDISSYDFGNFQTWQNPKELEKLDTDLRLHIHLMINLKPQEILKWNNSRVKIFVLHLEACNLPHALIKFAKRTKKEIIIAWSPNLDKEFIQEFAKYVDGILILGVMPGKSGQKFLEDTFKRIEEAVNFKRQFKNIKRLLVDGGINEENIKNFFSYEIDYLIIGNAIFGKENPIEAYRYLNSLI